MWQEAVAGKQVGQAREVGEGCLGGKEENSSSCCLDKVVER